MSLTGVLDLLACPHCGDSLRLDPGDRAVGCPAGHHFDLARQGYLNLVAARPQRAHQSDTMAMVAARDRFLSAGHYRPLAERLAELHHEVFADLARPRLLEVGAGTGYYLAHLLDRLPAADGVALDLSVPAARRAARAHPRLGSVVADTWAGLPVQPRSLEAITAVFAPRNPAEFARVLVPGGRLTVVGAGPDHLVELRAPLHLLDVQPDKAERLESSLEQDFVVLQRDRWTAALQLDPAALHDLVAMGPNAFHTDLESLTGLVDRLGPQRVTASAVVTVFSRR